jgi:hypothetical protein
VGVPFIVFYLPIYIAALAKLNDAANHATISD